MRGWEYGISRSPESRVIGNTSHHGGTETRREAGRGTRSFAKGRIAGPSAKGWGCHRRKFQAPEARHPCLIHISECNAHRFQYKRAAENHPRTNEGTPMGIHRRHLPAPRHLRPLHRRDGRSHSSVAAISTHLTIADAIRDIKSNSSAWMSSEIGRFAWQQGYGGFGVSKSNIAAVVRYIRNQEQHHARMTFEEEFIALLEKHGIEYDPQYVFG